MMGTQDTTGKAYSAIKADALINDNSYANIQLHDGAINYLAHSHNFDGSLNNLSDVDLSIPPISGQILRYDGTNWIAGNSTLSQVVSKLSAASGQTQFNTPNTITDINNISVFRNGISVDFISLGVNVIELVGISCFAGDKIKIIQIL